MAIGRMRLLLPLALLVAAVLTHGGGAGAGEGVNHDRDGDGNSIEHRYLPPPEGSAYSRECGSCHFLYHPGLLPEGSWTKLMGLDDHFGATLKLGAADRAAIIMYLKENSADRLRDNEWSEKIMRSLGALKPVRVTEVPYIVRGHGKIKKEVFARPSVKDLSNCGACHRAGAEGDFDDDNVRIPEK